MFATARGESEDPSRSRSERVRERFQATLAGLLELEVLRAKHKQMVEMALESSSSSSSGTKQSTPPGSYQYWLEGNSSRLRLSRSPSGEALDDFETCGSVQSWSRHSTEDLLLDSTGHSDEGPRAQAAWDCSSSRASSGFCGDDQSEMCGDDTDLSFLSNSFVSLSSQNALEASRTLRTRRPIMMKRSGGRSESREDSPTGSAQVIPQDGFLSVASLYPDSHWPDVSEILQPQVILESRYRSDLRCHLGTEVYRYPSPLHAVALQSPLYAPEGPIRQTRSLPRSTARPGSRPASIYLCSQSVFAGSESFCLSVGMCTLLPGHTCQTFPHAPCERHRLEAFIARLAQRQQHSKNPLCVSGPPRANPASSLRRTCSMGKGRISDNRKMFRNTEKAETLLDYTIMSSSKPPQGLRRATGASRSQGITVETNKDKLYFAPDEECDSVLGSKKVGEAHDEVDREPPSPAMVFYSPVCIRRSTVVSDLPMELASLRV